MIEAWELHQEAERNLPEVATLPLDSIEDASSIDGGEPARLLIKNDTDRPARLFWMDPEGNRVAKGWVRTGYDSEPHTFVGHVFLVTDADGKPLALFEAPAERSRGFVR